jgi:aspartyl-tRNA synthetase
MEELETDLTASTTSKKQLKKEARKAAKAEKSQAEEEDPFAANYGDVPIEQI